jgi:hypothetical protein
VEGIDLPSSVVQRGIDSFRFYTDKESVTLRAPFREKRIATVYRGAGPRGTKKPQWQSFDGHLLELAMAGGARLIGDRVTDIRWVQGKPHVHTKNGQSYVYDLVVGAIGVNTPSLDLFEKLGIGYERPRTRKTYNIELELGSSYISTNLGNSMHAFLLDLSSLDFAAIIPKGEYATVCLIGDDINTQFVDSFMRNPAVGRYLSGNADHSAAACRCAPLASLGDAVHPFGDRVVLVGDCGMTRLNKDGIGSAYRVAKIAAVTALFRGVSGEDFRKGYWPICRTISIDNRFGRIVYLAINVIKKSPLLTRAVMRMAGDEQKNRGRQPRMSTILWDMFTGSSAYRDVLFRCLHPGFWSRFGWSVVKSISGSAGSIDTVDREQEEIMEKNILGKDYDSGDVIVHEGEVGNSMYVIQSGQVEVIQSREGQDVRLAVLGKGDIFGEMAIFQEERRSATVRSLTNVRVLTVDKRIFLRRVHEDPSFAFAILQKMSQRVQELDEELTRIRT